MVDKEKIKSFWDSRADMYSSVAFESIANLEQDPENLKLKIELETGKVQEYIGSVEGKSVLDLGAGVGQWSFRFVDGQASSVTAVEYSAPLAEIGRVEARRRGANNIEFVVSAAEKYKTNKKFDIVFISGLFVYLNDEQAELLAANIRSFCAQDAIVLLRDGTALGDHYEIDNRMSDHLQTLYSAVYRTRSEYLDLFTKNGLVLQRDENMFYDGCPLNKYPETRLRIYKFFPE